MKQLIAASSHCCITAFNWSWLEEPIRGAYIFFSPNYVNYDKIGYADEGFLFPPQIKAECVCELMLGWIQCHESVWGQRGGSSSPQNVSKWRAGDPEQNSEVRSPPTFTLYQAKWDLLIKPLLLFLSASSDATEAAECGTSVVSHSESVAGPAELEL